MPSTWIIANLDTQERTVPTQKILELLWGSVLAPELITVPKWPTKPLWPMTDKLLAIRTKASAAALLKLPFELLYLIFAHIDDMVDAMCLCFAHDILGAVGERRFRELHARRSGAWAGHRLIALSDSAPDFALPASVSEVYKTQTGQELPEGSVGAFYRHVEKTYRERRLGFGVRHNVYTRDDKERLLRMCKCPRDRTAYMALYNAIDVAYHREDFVLCNLTKGEYVRSEDVRRLSVRTKTTRGFSVDLSVVVFSNICGLFAERWSFWAGDAFEITSLGCLRPGVEWEDVTEREVGRLAQLFWSLYG